MAHKHNLSALSSLPDSVSVKEGKSIGGVWVVYQIAKQLGIEKALGTGQSGRLALWQVIARVLEQGSRLSAVRLGETHAIAAALSLKKGVTEDALYDNLAWLAHHQARIEDELFVKNKRNTTL